MRRSPTGFGPAAERTTRRTYNYGVKVTPMVRVNNWKPILIWLSAVLIAVTGFFVVRSSVSASSGALAPESGMQETIKCPSTSCPNFDSFNTSDALIPGETPD